MATRKPPTPKVPTPRTRTPAPKGAPKKTDAKRKSFADQVRQMSTATKQKAPATLAKLMIQKMRQRGKAVGSVTIGKLYHFAYDPKLKKVLPYYDTQPVVIPIQMYSDGFLGLNFHYLDPYSRAALLDRLVHAYEKGKNENARLKVSYGILKAASSMSSFGPCLHRYLYPQVRSTFLEIPRDDWALTVSLPLAKFVGAGQGTVWKHSLMRS